MIWNLICLLKCSSSWLISFCLCVATKRLQRIHITLIKFHEVVLFQNRAHFRAYFAIFEMYFLKTFSFLWRFADNSISFLVGKNKFILSDFWLWSGHKLDFKWHWIYFWSSSIHFWIVSRLKSFKTNLCVLMPECEHKSLWKCPSLSIGPPIKSSAHELNDRRLMRGKRLVDALAPSPEVIHKQRSQKLELFWRIFFVANSQLVLS